MTEAEKTFIDKLANGINPLDDTPIPDDDIVNNVRLSRCFFYVSGVLEKAMEREKRNASKKSNFEKAPFSVTDEQLAGYEFGNYPLSVTAFCRRINELPGNLKTLKMERLPSRKITQFLTNIGMIEWKLWENGKMKRFPTEAGKEIGLELKIWESYGRKSPVIYYSDQAQRFILDNLDAVIATDIRRDKDSNGGEGETDEEQGE